MEQLERKWHRRAKFQVIQGRSQNFRQVAAKLSDSQGRSLQWSVTGLDPLFVERGPFQQNFCFCFETNNNNINTDLQGPKFNGTQRELLQNKTFLGGDQRSPNLMGRNVSPSKIKTLTGFDFLFFGGAKFRKIKDRKAKNRVPFRRS